MEHITPRTIGRIHGLARELPQGPTVYTDTHQFAVDYEDRWYDDEDVCSFRTLITGDEKSLVVNAVNQDGLTVIFENIDLSEDGVPMIVRPELPRLMREHGVGMLQAFLAGNIKIGRPVVRALTEYEGNALIEDLEEVLIHRPYLYTTEP